MNSCGIELSFDDMTSLLIFMIFTNWLKSYKRDIRRHTDGQTSWWSRKPHFTFLNESRLKTKETCQNFSILIHFLIYFFIFFSFLPPFFRFLCRWFLLWLCFIHLLISFDLLFSSLSVVLLLLFFSEPSWSNRLLLPGHIHIICERSRLHRFPYEHKSDIQHEDWC